MANAVFYARLLCGKQTHKGQRCHMRVHDVVLFFFEFSAQRAYTFEKRKYGRKMKHPAAARNNLLVKRRGRIGVKIKLHLGRVDISEIIHNAVYNAARRCVAYNLRYLDFFVSHSVILPSQPKRFRPKLKGRKILLFLQKRPLCRSVFEEHFKRLSQKQKSCFDNFAKLFLRKKSGLGERVVLQDFFDKKKSRGLQVVLSITRTFLQSFLQRNFGIKYPFSVIVCKNTERGLLS